MVLCVAVFPYLTDTVYSLAIAPAPPPPLVIADSALLLSRSLCAIAACVCILFLTQQPFRSVGLRPFKKIDIGLAILTIGVALGAHSAFGYIVYNIFDEPATIEYARPSGLMDWYWFSLSHIANAGAEELAIWGLLYTRLRRLWHRQELLSMIAPAAAFAAYHLYQGVAPAIMVFVFAMVHGLIFRVSGRLWPLILAHAATNIWFQS